MASLIEIHASSGKKIAGAPGQSLVADVSGLGGCAGSMEVYSAPGIMGRPASGTRGVEVSVSGIRVVVATHHYGIAEDIAAGETLLYGMDDAAAITCKIVMKGDGHIVIKNDEEDLKTLIGDLINELIALKTAGSPASHTVDPGSVANLNQIKMRFDALLG